MRPLPLVQNNSIIKQPKSKMGLYVHIPFCQHACHYCDFNFSTLTKYIDPWINALVLEMGIYKTLLSKYSIHTLYFGGGTPSLLKKKQWEKIFENLHQNYNLENLQEQTLETNPEDLSTSNLKYWQSLGFSRLSIGLQSFNNHVLKWMNRHHTANQSIQGILRAKNCGISNINVDFIYNIPINGVFYDDLSTFLSLKLPHLSCYSLTIEEKTVFGQKQKNNQLQTINEKNAINETVSLWTALQNEGYNHYEISNFCLPGYESIHNANYWKHIPYIGMGSSAHSFIDNKRWSNIKSNGRYIHALKHGKSPVSEKEILTNIDIYNEKIMFGLRTSMGISLKFLESIYHPVKNNNLIDTVEKWISSGHIVIENDKIKLNLKGKFIANTIIQDLFIEDVSDL